MTSPYPTPEVELQDMRTHLQAHEALLVASKDAHAVLDIVLSAADPDAAQRTLIERYGFTHRQARAVTDVQIHRLTRSELDHIERRWRQLSRALSARENDGARLTDDATKDDQTRPHVHTDLDARGTQPQPRRRSVFVEWAPRAGCGIEELQVGQVGTVVAWAEYHVDVVWAGLEDQMVTTGMVFDEQDLREIDVRTFADRVLA